MYWNIPTVDCEQGLAGAGLIDDEVVQGGGHQSLGAKAVE
jgi:hypothetical protein